LEENEGKKETYHIDG